jgi:hypothetical protein
LEEEGVVLDNFLLVVDGGEFCEAEFRHLLASATYPARRPDVNVADIKAQIAAAGSGRATRPSAKLPVPQPTSSGQGAPWQPHGSFLTRRWRKADSNCRSHPEKAVSEQGWQPLCNARRFDAGTGTETSKGE